MTGIEIIAAERQRQIEEEGYTMEKDKQYNTKEELAIAAMCYACPKINIKSSGGPLVFFTGREYPSMWPWDKVYWKPTPDDRIRELAKAGALIAAEIDRLQEAPVYTEPDKHYAFVDRKCHRCAGDGVIG